MKSLEQRQSERASAKLFQLRQDGYNLPDDFKFSGFSGPFSLGGIGYTAKVGLRGNGGIAGEAGVSVEPDESNANGRSVASFGTPVASQWGDGWPNSDGLAAGSAD